MTKKYLTASIITIGTEIVKGKLIDSNSSWISNFLLNKGLETEFHISVSDEKSDIINAFNMLNQSDIEV